MDLFGLTVWLLLFAFLNSSDAVDPLTTGAIVVGVLSGGLGWYDKTLCRFMECCYQHSVKSPKQVVEDLQNDLRTLVYGQHLMQDTVIRAIRDHLNQETPSKALTLSFHGSPGNGKSYVSSFIAKALYHKGSASSFVHKFTAGINFPSHDQSAVFKYKVELTNIIQSAVKSCSRSLFIFEDVSKYPEGVLDAIHPFIDYHETINGVDYRKAIFILISNTGQNIINQKALEMWKSGKDRNDIQLKDFEDEIRKGVFNELGGLKDSTTISSNLIDFYVPFLPLEEKHVIQCIRDAYLKYTGSSSVPENLRREIMDEISFLPEGVEIFATSGCKRLESKVSSAISAAKFESRQF